MTPPKRVMRWSSLPTFFLALGLVDFAARNAGNPHLEGTLISPDEGASALALALFFDSLHAHMRLARHVRVHVAPAPQPPQPPPEPPPPQPPQPPQPPRRFGSQVLPFFRVTFVVDPRLWSRQAAARATARGCDTSGRPSRLSCPQPFITAVMEGR